MKFVFDITHNMYRATSLFSFIFAGLGDALASGNPTKGSDSWKEKCEAMEHRCFNIQYKVNKL